MVGISHETGEVKEVELVGAKSVRELRCVKLIAEDDSTYIIRITDGMTPGKFRERVIALGINRFKSADISAASEEIPWVESLFDGFTFQGKTEWTRPSGPIIYGPFVVKVTLTNRYFRAIAKIGFHYFLTKYPRFQGDEPCFEEIRNFIMHDCRVDEIGRFVTQSQKQFVYELREGYGIGEWGHLVAVECDYTGFRAKIQLFVGPQSLPPVYTVKLGKNPSRIHYSEAYGDFFRYYSEGDRTEFDGEVSSLGAIARP